MSLRSNQLRCQDVLYATALQAVRYVGTGKAVIADVAKQHNLSQYDAEMAMQLALARVETQLHELRVADRDRAIRKMKNLKKKMDALQKQLDSK